MTESPPPASASQAGTASLPRSGRPVLDANRGDRVFRWLAGAMAGVIVLALGAMALQLTRTSAATIERFGLGFLVGRDWDPIQEQYGALPFLFGSLASSLLALALAVPVALGTGIYLSELSRGAWRRPIGFLVELLAAIPSVVYGLWGIFVLVPWMRGTVEPRLAELFGFLPFFRGTPRGFDLLTGGVVLAIMILPTVAAVSRDVLAAVPNTLREGALALGATRWDTIRQVVLPCARSGIVGAVILGLGRALGETMAVTMVIGNRPNISLSLFEPAYTMASVIANEYAEATDRLNLAALSELGLLLFAVTLLLSLAARLLVWRVGRLPGGGRS